MDQYKCLECNKSFSSRKAIDYHNDHKVCRKCYCEKCGVHFSSHQNLKRHIAHNICKKHDKLKLVLKKEVPIPENLTIRGLYEENLQLKGQVEALKSHPQTVKNVKNIQNVIVVPPAFLTLDSVAHLTKMLPELLHKAISEHGTECVSFVIKQTNCNPKLPLYNSVKITNKKDSYAQISDGTNYVYITKKKAIGELIENKRHILQEYIDTYGEKYGDKILKRYQRYVDRLDDDPETQKELEDDIACMLLNVSNVIGSDDWTKKLLEDLKHGNLSDE